MDYEATLYQDASIVGMIGVILIVWLLVVLALGIFSMVCMWRVFAKAGIPGWKAIIPFYNVYCLCKLTWGIGWLFLIIFTPLLFDVFSWVVMVGFMITHWKLAKQFGKSDGFAIGTAVLPLVFLAILAFGNATYEG